MLPPFIIEQIRQREERARRDDAQPRLELPLDRMPSPKRPADVDEDEADRGVIILELL